MRRAGPLIALTLLVVLGGCSSGGSSDRSDGPDRNSGPTVTCRATSGGANRDRAVLQRRVRAIAKDGSVAVAGNTVRLHMPGATRAKAVGLCRRGELELRPLIAPTVRVSGGSHTDPLAGLDFAVPKDESSYSRLSSADQQSLARHLAAASCAPTSSGTSPVVACGPVGGGSDAKSTSAALLAAPVLDASGVESASAEAPLPGQGITTWYVDLVLTTSARSSWSRYTTDHNASGASADQVDPARCAATVVPCSTWVGFVADGKLVSLPVTNEPITQGKIAVTGRFTKDSAAELAGALGAGALPAPLSLVSVR